MAVTDVLFDTRNYFYLGAYQQCINEAQNAKCKSEEERLQKDSFLYRSYISLNKYSIPLEEIDVSNSASELLAIRRLAEYLANNDNRSKIVNEITNEIEKNAPEDDISLLMNAMIFLYENKVEDALRLLSYSSTSLECSAAKVQCLLKLHRPDLATKELKNMQQLDEDATITQLANAWVNMALDKEKLKDAFYIYQELIDKYGASPTLLISQASCLVQQQKYEEAEKLFQEAQQRDPNNAEVMIGLYVLAQILGKPIEVSNRYLNQLKQDHPNHLWTKDVIAKELELDHLITSE